MKAEAGGRHRGKSELDRLFREWVRANGRFLSEKIVDGVKIERYDMGARGIYALCSYAPTGEGSNV